MALSCSSAWAGSSWFNSISKNLPTRTSATLENPKDLQRLPDGTPLGIQNARFQGNVNFCPDHERVLLFRARVVFGGTAFAPNTRRYTSSR